VSDFIFISSLHAFFNSSVDKVLSFAFCRAMQSFITCWWPEPDASGEFASPAHAGELNNVAATKAQLNHSFFMGTSDFWLVIATNAPAAH
jgi:hypothetical protein